ncbi:MAG: helix-turn-helix transcriptional regulator [Actinomycetota bacterium]
MTGAAAGIPGTNGRPGAHAEGGTGNYAPVMADRQPTGDQQPPDGNEGNNSDHGPTGAQPNAEEPPSLILLGGGGADAGRPESTGAEAHEAGGGEAEADIRLRDVIGQTLRDERLRQGRTLADVAEEAAVSLQYLSEVERGRKEISSDLLHVVHHALGLDLHQVLERAARRLELRAQGSRTLLLAA